MATTPSQLNGLFKEAYGDDIMNLIPEAAKLIKLIPFVSRDKETGNKYHQPIVVASEQGVTYAAADSGAFALEESISMNMQDAQVQGSQMLLRSALSYDAASRASNSTKAFVKGTELLVDNMLESITKRLEISMLHGQKGIADIAVGEFVESAPGSTTATFEITEASFAAGIWAGAEKAKLVFYSDSSDTVASGTNLDANADANKDLVISAVNVDLRTVTVTGTAAAIEDINDVSVTKALRVYFKGSVVGSGLTFKYNEMAGLNKIINNTATLFNVNAAEYNLWKGNVHTLTGKITMAKLLAGISKAVSRGLNEKVVACVNPDTWNALNDELAALRRFDGSYDSKKSENGTESIKYYAQNGEVEIVSHILVKAGEVFVFPPKRAKRIGSQEISFKTPSMGEDIFLHLPNNAGFEMRVYSDQSLFIEAPSRCVYVTGFTNV